MCLIEISIISLFAVCDDITTHGVATPCFKLILKIVFPFRVGVLKSMSAEQTIFLHNLYSKMSMNWKFKQITSLHVQIIFTE